MCICVNEERERGCVGIERQKEEAEQRDRKVGTERRNQRKRERAGRDRAKWKREAERIVTGRTARLGNSARARKGNGNGRRVKRERGKEQRGEVKWKREREG